MRNRKQLKARDHPAPEVQAALKDILGRPGWLLVEGGHWGQLLCEPGCHRIGVSGTPRTPAPTPVRSAGRPTRVPCRRRIPVVGLGREGDRVDA